MTIDIYSIQWEHEDDLPEITEFEYDLIYQKSKLEFGVRVFPFIEYWQDGIPKKLYLGA